MKFLLLLFFYLQIISCNSDTKNDTLEKLEMRAYNASQAEDYKSSFFYYNQLILKDSTNGGYYFGRGESYMMSYQVEEAKKDYLKSIQLNFRKGDCFFNLGLLNTYFNDSVALIYFKKALDIYPEHSKIQKAYDECINRLRGNSKPLFP